MAGIDSIIERIEKEAKESADARVARAESDAAKLISKKQEQAKEEEAKMLADAQAAVDAQTRQNRASLNTRSQRRILQERVALINEIVEEAKARIRALPTEERLAMVAEFVASNCEGADGQLILSKQDKDALPASFLSDLSRKTGSTITLSDEPGDFDCGCVLICEDCEYNGTLDALADDRSDAIRDAVNQVLLAKK